MIRDRFEAYFLRKGSDFDKFWREYLRSDLGNVLFVMGLSFDPRSLECLKVFRTCNPQNIRYVILSYDHDFADSPHMARMLENNKRDLESLIPAGERHEIEIAMMKGGQSASVDAAKALESHLEGCSDIVIDVTGMPLGVYFPMVRSILQSIKSSGAGTNLHITVSENPQLDSKIAEISDSDKPSSMYMFNQSLEKESLRHLPKVWIPVLGKGRKPQLDKISEEVSPKETVPVFPVPSLDPYLARDILLEYHKLLATPSLEPRNFVYSDEQNPFETRKKIRRTALYYYKALDTLGGCIVVISPTASKLLCVGCLLAACDLLDDGKRVGIEYAIAQSYRIDEDAASDWEAGTLFTMWVAGGQRGR